MPRSDDTQPPHPSPKSVVEEEREARRAAALRANLRRRKTGSSKPAKDEI